MASQHNKVSYSRRYSKRDLKIVSCTGVPVKCIPVIPSWNATHKPTVPLAPPSRQEANDAGEKGTWEIYACNGMDVVEIRGSCVYGDYEKQTKRSASWLSRRNFHGWSAVRNVNKLLAGALTLSRRGDHTPQRLTKTKGIRSLRDRRSHT